MSRVVPVGGRPSATPPTAPPDHEAGWEYLYLAAEFERGLAALDARYARYLDGEVAASGVVVRDPRRDVRVQSDDLRARVGAIDALFTPSRLEGAFGPPGRPGDESQIRSLARGVVEVFEGCLRWGEEIRAVSVPPEWRGAYAALADFVTGPLEEIREFSRDLSALARSIADDVRHGRTPTSDQQLTLRISLDPEIERRFEDALDALRRR